MPNLSPQQFVNKWHRVSLKERSASQSHFNDLCDLVGHPQPVEMDPTGERFCFEAGATKQSGGNGWADVWKRGFFAWEYKGRHADLDAAYKQLLLYRESLENPPLLIVSDMDQIVIHTNFTNTVKRVTRIATEDLLDPAMLTLLRDAFTAPERFRVPRTPDEVTQEAAARFARLAELLRAQVDDPEQAAHFMIRLLFCLFAEDTGLLPEGLFTRLIQRARRRPEAFAAQLQQLFGAMSLGGWFGEHEIPYFDGALFDDARAIPLEIEGLDVLAGIADLDWGSIEPSILGTLFERSLDPDKRAQLGAHYTSRDDILLIVEPVLMAPLRRRWDAVRAQVGELVEKREASTAAATQTRLTNEARAALIQFAGEIAAVQVLDPACGSGNFLYVALRQLLDLWKAVYTTAFRVTGTPLMLQVDPSPSPLQLHGIEINPYAHELAQTTIWIGYLQWLRENGFGTPAEPILRPLHAVEHTDAILAHDAEGHTSEPSWPQADVIIGNPPFLGDRKMRRELGDAYVDDVRDLYSGRLPSSADLVCYWFEKARALVASGNAKRAGLLATQGIRGKSNRVALERIKGSGDIFWAYSDREWVVEGATVHVSMVAFDNGDERSRELDGQPVRSINPDLTSTVDVTQALPLLENRRIAFVGTQKSGPFDIDSDAAEAMLLMVGNPNGRPNADVVKPWINATDVTRYPRGKWIIDFGHKTTLAEAAEYEVPFEYVRKVVKPVRDKVRRKSHRERWWLFGDSRPGLREATQDLARYIVTPMVSKHRVFAMVANNVISENLLIAIAREDDYFLGVLQSHPHELWSRRAGTQLREATSGARYTPSTVFVTYPFPWPPGREPGGVTPGEEGDPRVRAIAEAARELVAKRQAWLHPEGATEVELKKRTLTNLYNARPTWLDLAHKKLDAAVFAAYGWPEGLSDEEVLERLLGLNLARAGQSSAQ